MSVVWQTVEEFREWANGEHPSVLRELAEGKATIVKSEWGPQWFGSESAPIVFAAWFFCQEVLGHKRVPFTPQGIPDWPSEFEYNGWQFALATIAPDTLTATYCRTDVS